MQAIRHWMAATLGALVVLAAPAAIAQAPAATVKVGLIGPFTGPSSDFGIPLRQGIELAVAEINTAGGYLGRPRELVVHDDKGDPDRVSYLVEIRNGKQVVTNTLAPAKPL